jgi:hypothetical protein
MDIRSVIISILGKLESKDNGILKYHPSSRINFELLRDSVSQFENADQFKSAFKTMCLRTLNENPSYAILHKHALRMYIFGLNIILADLEHSFVDERPCATCNELSHPDRTLLCDCCNDPYHTFCLALPDDIPSGTWFCRDCSILEQNYLLQRALSGLDRQQHPPQSAKKETRRPVYVRTISFSASSSEESEERVRRRVNRRQQERPMKSRKKKKHHLRGSNKQQSSSTSSTSSSSSSSSSSDSSSTSSEDSAWNQKQARILKRKTMQGSVFKKEIDKLIHVAASTSSLRKSNRELQSEAASMQRAIGDATFTIDRLGQAMQHSASRRQVCQLRNLC